MKLSDYVMAFVARQGVKHVFLVPGGGAMHLNDSLGQCRELQFVCNLHEQASVVAAEAYSRITGNIGVAMVTTGPGGTNAITGVVGAWQDSIPLLVISGQVKRSDLMQGLGVRQRGVQEVDIVSLVRTVTKYAVMVTDPLTIRYHLEKAFYLAHAGRPGPVWIDLPLDVQAASIDSERLAAFGAAECAPPVTEVQGLSAQVNETSRLLAAAERPILLVGFGTRLAGAQAEFLELVERLGIPVLTTWAAMDLIPDGHPLLAGRPGPLAPRGANFALQNADCLLAIGARLDQVLTAYAPEKLARAAKKIMVDIDPAEIRKLGAVIDVPVCSDAREFIRALLRETAAQKRRDCSDWLARCRKWKADYPVVQPTHRAPGGKVSVYYLSEILCEETAEGDIIVPGSSGSGIELFMLAMRVKAGQRVFNTTALGPMGFGIPHVIGACVAAGGRRTVLVDGDGGFQFNIQELQTISRLNLPLKIFVLSNRGFASIRASQQRYFGRLTAADDSSGLTLPDVGKVAAAYGLATARIESQTGLRAQVRRILAQPGPVVCDVTMIPDEVRAPAIASRARPDGTMVSTPLEDLWPFLPRDEFRANMIVPPLED